MKSPKKSVEFHNFMEKFGWKINKLFTGTSEQSRNSVNLQLGLFEEQYILILKTNTKCNLM